MILTVKEAITPASHPPAIGQLNLKPFNFKIFTEEDLKHFLANLKPGNHIALYALDNNNYMTFDADLLELQRYIEEQNQVIIFYQQLEKSGRATEPDKK